MVLLYFVLLILATICFGLAALNKPVGKLNIIALGLFFWMLVPTIQMLNKLS